MSGSTVSVPSLPTLNTSNTYNLAVHRQHLGKHDPCGNTR